MDIKCLDLEPYGIHSLRFTDILVIKSAEPEIEVIYPLINVLIKLKLIKNELEKYDELKYEVKLGAALISAFSKISFFIYDPDYLSFLLILEFCLLEVCLVVFILGFVILVPI